MLCEKNLPNGGVLVDLVLILVLMEDALRGYQEQHNSCPIGVS